MESKINIGFPIMQAEKGEKRAFLPEFMQGLIKNNYQIVLENGYGSRMGYSPEDYLFSPNIRFGTPDEVYNQDIVLVLRYPGDDYVRKMRPGACLISMLHYPTRPNRVAFLRERQVEAISIDEIKDDSGRRIVENLRAVAWNGIEVAFNVLSEVYPPPGFDSPFRLPIHVLLMGAGGVGRHAAQAAVRYGDEKRWSALASQEVPGVRVSVVEYDLTHFEKTMRDLLSETDILIDATQRLDVSQPVIPNEWIGDMPQHAILLDLSVDPYDFSLKPPEVKGIEGIPQGNLDKYIFPPDDPAYEAIPDAIPVKHRRYAISCYSWPGIHPKQCMEVYGKQLRPLFRTISESGGVNRIPSDGRFFHRALSRAMLSRWHPG